MKVFISWSGSTSKRLAEVFKEWVPAVIQAVKPYFSPNDVDKGSRWYTEISKELDQSKVGLICLTRENLDAPWIMFEAGALSKSVDKSRVIPLLFGVDTADLKGPLLQFQAAVFGKDEVRRLLKTINSVLGEAALEASVLETVFEKWWPDLEERILDALKEQQQENRIVLRTDRDVLEEILERVRTITLEERHNEYPALGVGFNTVDTLGLKANTTNKLKALHILYIVELIQKTEQELLMMNISRKSLYEIKEALACLGLRLGIRVPTVDK